MEFLKNKSVTDPDELKALFRGVEEVDEMLRFNVVQGELNENGNYGMTSSEKSPIFLLIHSQVAVLLQYRSWLYC